MRPNIFELCRVASARWQKAWLPGNTLVVDESVYEYLGASPCHVYIPRKPHPNGLLSYGLSGYTAVMKLPMLLDMEPWVPSNKLTARESAEALVDRFRIAHPHLQPHIVMDSLFGSFSDVRKYYAKGVLVTMSMAQKPKSWLWDMLGWRCPLNSGRASLLPLDENNHYFLASLYHTRTESDKIVDIRTVTSAFSFEPPEASEPTVARIGGRRSTSQGLFEYETHWLDGDITWQLGQSFMDADGTFNIYWLQKAKGEDIREVLADLTVDQLTCICRHQSWKVRSYLRASGLLIIF